MSAGRQKSSRKPLDSELLGCRATAEPMQSTLGLLPYSSKANKRCRAASDTQATTSMYDRNSDNAARRAVQHSKYRIVPSAGSRKRARASAAPVHHRHSRCHRALPPADPAALESFRPFLQQLAAGIVAGFSATKAQDTSHVAGDAPDAEVAVASILQTTAAAPAVASSDAHSSWQPSELTPQHIVNHMMLMAEPHGGCGILPPRLGHSTMSDVVDAVAFVSRRTRGRKQQAAGKGAARECPVLGGDTDHHASAAAVTGGIQTAVMQMDQFKAGSSKEPSIVPPQVNPSPPATAGPIEAEEPMTPPTADITAIGRLTAAAPDSTAAVDATSGAGTDAHAQQSDFQQEQTAQHLMPRVLISSSQYCDPQQQQVSHTPESPLTGADRINHITGSSAIQGAGSISPAAAAPVVIPGIEPLTSCRASTGIETSQEQGQSAAGGTGSSSDSLTTAAGADTADRINSIRQHVMFLEATLGNRSTQVASAYLFLADVLQSDGSHCSSLDAARALATAQDILTSTAAQ